MSSSKVAPRSPTHNPAISSTPSAGPEAKDKSGPLAQSMVDSPLPARLPDMRAAASGAIAPHVRALGETTASVQPVTPPVPDWDRQALGLCHALDSGTASDFCIEIAGQIPFKKLAPDVAQKLAQAALSCAARFAGGHALQRSNDFGGESARGDFADLLTIAARSLQGVEPSAQGGIRRAVLKLCTDNIRDGVVECIGPAVECVSKSGPGGADLKAEVLAAVIAYPEKDRGLEFHSRTPGLSRELPALEWVLDQADSVGNPLDLMKAVATAHSRRLPDDVDHCHALELRIAHSAMHMPGGEALARVVLFGLCRNLHVLDGQPDFSRDPQRHAAMEKQVLEAVAHCFKCIEAPSPAAGRLALQLVTFRFSSALALGERIAELPLEPRARKLLLDGLIRCLNKHDTEYRPQTLDPDWADRLAVISFQVDPDGTLFKQSKYPELVQAGRKFLRDNPLQPTSQAARTLRIDDATSLPGELSSLISQYAVESTSERLLVKLREQRQA